MGVQVSVVLTRVKGSILLWYEEERGSLGGFRGDYPSGLQMFFNKGFACLHFCWIERINLGNLGSEVGMKFDGMVIGTMGRELIVSFL